MKSPFGILTHNRGTGTLYDGSAKIATVEAPEHTPKGYALEVSRAVRLRDCANACHGLPIPPDVPPGALAALVDAARRIAHQWEDLRSLPPGEDLSALAAALAPFTTDPGPPVSSARNAFESDPLGNGKTPPPQ